MAQTIATPAAPARRRFNAGSVLVAVLLLLVFSPLLINIATQAVANPILFIEALKIGLINGAIITIIALGYTLVYGIIELINFAHGDVYMLGAFATLILFGLLSIGPQTPWAVRAPALLAIFVAVMAITALVNVGIERFAYRRLRNAPRLAPLISAIGVSFIIQNIGLVLGGMSIRQGDYWALVALIAPVLICAVALAVARRLQAGERQVPWWGWLMLVLIAVVLSFSGFNLMHSTLQSAAPIEVGTSIMGNTASGPKSLPEVIAGPSTPPAILLANDEGRTLFRMTWKDIMVLVVSGLLMIGLYLFVQRTRVGKAMRATAQDRDAARLMGINVDQTIALAFLLGGALAGAAGMIVGMYNNTAVFTMGFTAGLRAFTSAVLGGIGNIMGAMLGGMIIGVLASLSDIYIETRWTNAVVFGILVIILVFRPSGLLGEEGGQKA
ncbi:MAG: branched-chain amino acid ABC transporter permease [Roseiflexaceae bacterium]